MKINFSNLAKLFLAGVCFVAVGCTDYGQDIDNLRTEMNDRFEELESNTIDPLKADLEKTKETLAEAQKAIADHATQHAADIAALQAADAALNEAVTKAANDAAEALAAKAAELTAAFEAADSKLAGDITALAAELVAKAAELQKNITDVDAKTQANAQAIIDAAAKAAQDLADVKKALEDADKALEDRLTTANTELAAALRAELAAESKKITDLIDAEVKKLEEALAKAISDFNTALAQTDANVAKNAEAIAANAANIGTNAAAIEANAKAIAENAAAIEANAKAIEALDKIATEAIEDVKASLAATEALLKSEIAATKSELELAYAAADEAVRAALQQNIDTLESTLNDKINALESKLEKEVARLDGDIQKNADAIEGLKTSLAAAVAALEQKITDTKAELEQAIKNGDEAVKAELKEAITIVANTVTELSLKVEEYVAKLQTEILDINNRITGLDEKFENKIKEVEAALEITNAAVKANAEKIEGLIATLEQAVLDLTKRDDELEAMIKDLEGVVSTIRTDLDNHIAAYATFKSEIEGRVATLETEVEQLKAKDIELQGLIGKLDDRLKANEELAAKNAQDIKDNKALFDAYVLATNETLALLKDADVLLQSNIDALDGRLEAYKAQVRAELDAHYGAFATYQAEVEGKFELVEQQFKAQTAALNAAKAELELAIDALGVKVDALTERVSALETAHNELKGAHDKLAGEFDAYKKSVDATLASIDEKQVEQDGKIKLNADQIAALQTEVNDLKKKVDDNYNTLNTKIDELNASFSKLIEDLSADLEALKGRIQSLVFVPEYSDGKATIEYAKVGDSIVEGESKFWYQVYPSECASAIKVADLQFVFTEALKTRAAEPMLEVVDVKIKDASKGIIEVTAQAHYLHPIYDGSKEYAVSLVFNHKVGEVENSIASCYTNLIAEKSSEVTEITWKLNEGYTKAAELEYIATNSVNVLGGINYIFFENGKEQTHDYIFKHYGLTVKEAPVAPTYNKDTYNSAHDGAEKASKEVFSNVEREDNGYDVSIAIAADKATVGLVQTIGFGYNLHTITNGTIAGTPVAKLVDYATVEITKIKGHMTLEAQTITWTRSLDNEEDGITPKTPTSRKVATVAGKLLDINGEELTTAGTTYADIITGTASITVNGEPIAAPYNVVFGGTTEAPTVLFEGFEWDKEYKIVASYEIDNIVAELSIDLTTKMPTRVVNLGTANVVWNYAADKNSEKNYPGQDKALTTFRAVELTADDADLYAKVIAQGKTVNKGENGVNVKFTETGVEASAFEWNKDYPVKHLFALEDEFVTVNVIVHTEKAPMETLTIALEDAQWKLTADFVNKSETPAEALLPVFEGLTNLGAIEAEAYLKEVFVTYPATVNKNEANGVEAATSKLEVAADGQSIKSVYGLEDFTIVPAAVDYELDVTTWYGQNIKFTKKLNINLQKVTLALPEAQWMVYEGFVHQSETGAESLANIYEQLVAGVTLDPNFAEADFLKAIFVDHAQTAATTANGVDAANTKLVVVADGQSIKSVYNMNEIATTEDKVDYTYNYKTWYGQEIEITKTLLLGVKPVEITLAAKEWELTKNSAVEQEALNKDNAGLEQLYSQLVNKTVDPSFTQANYLSAIFSNIENVVVTTENEDAAGKFTKLVVAADGQSIAMNYSMKEYPTTLDGIEYTYSAKTWYGQEIKFTQYLTLGVTPIQIELPHNPVYLTKDLRETFGPYSLSEIYAKVTKVNTTDFSEAGYLKHIFVDNAYEKVDLANNEQLTNTKLVVNGDTDAGATVVAKYDYEDFNVTPKDVAYKSTYTTWYGQEIEVTKATTVNWNTYKYIHVPKFVYKEEGQAPYSNAIPKYENLPILSTLLDYIRIELDMNTAFNLVDENNKMLVDANGASLALRATELKDTYGLVSTFDFAETPEDYTGITFPYGGNLLKYHGTDASVKVKATLKLVNSNGVETILPEAFTEYNGYYVNQHNPIGILKKNNLTINIAPIAKKYTYYVKNQLELTDERGKQLIAHGTLLDTPESEETWSDGGWVVGAPAGEPENGFATGRSVADIYGLKFEKFVCEGIPAEVKGLLVFNEVTGELYFDNTNQIELTDDITITVHATIKHTWGTVTTGNNPLKITIKRAR